MHLKKVIIYVFALIFFLACSGNEDKKSMNENVFDVVDGQFSGITFANNLNEKGALNIIEYLYYYNGGGVAVGDIDGDGLEDIFFSGNQTPDQLYLNKGGLKFENITAKAGIKPLNTWSTGVNMDDVNGDGLLDIYICKVAMSDNLPEEHNLLYINQGNGTFKELSKEYGLDFKGFSTQAAFLD